MAGMETTGITLLGLGPGGAELLTRQAWEALQSASEIIVQSAAHPALPAEIAVQVLESGPAEAAAEAIVELGRRPQGVLFGVPGHPLAANAAAGEVIRLARQAGLPVRIISGLSFVEPALAALGLEQPAQLSLVEAVEASRGHTPGFPPHTPALLTALNSPALAQRLKAILLHVYPEAHPLTLVRAAGALCLEIPLAARGEQPETTFGPTTCLYIPPLGPATSFEGFMEIVAHLRAPEGCPWDREQTHLSLRQSLLEETYEVLAALDASDAISLMEELGDLLLQIVLHAQISNEFAEFRMADVIYGIQTKLVRRHPHVFGDTQVSGVENVLQNWEKLKAAERVKKGKAAASLLDGVPKALPALTQAEQYQSRAARVGFEWPKVENVLDKIHEEIEELRQAGTPEERAFEMGDLFLAAVNLARWLEIDPESALRQANQRFRSRFGFIENAARSQERQVSDLSLEEMLHLWESAKQADA